MLFEAHRHHSAAPQDDRDLDALLGIDVTDNFARGSFCFWLPGTMMRFLPGMRDLGGVLGVVSGGHLP